MDKQRKVSLIIILLLVISALRFYLVKTDYFKNRQNSKQKTQQNKSSNNDSSPKLSQTPDIEKKVLESLPNARLIKVTKIPSSVRSEEYDYEYLFECDDYTFHVYDEVTKHSRIIWWAGLDQYYYEYETRSDRIKSIYDNNLKEEVDSIIASADLDPRTTFNIKDEEFVFVIASYYDIEKLEKAYYDVFDLFKKYSYKYKNDIINDGLVFNIKYSDLYSATYYTVPLLYGTNPDIHTSVVDGKYKYIDVVSTNFKKDDTIDHNTYVVKKVVINNCNNQDCNHYFDYLDYVVSCQTFCYFSINFYSKNMPTNVLKDTFALYKLLNNKESIEIKDDNIKEMDIYSRNSTGDDIVYYKYENSSISPIEVLFNGHYLKIPYDIWGGGGDSNRYIISIEEVYKAFGIKITNIDYLNGIIYVEKE